MISLIILQLSSLLPPAQQQELVLGPDTYSDYQQQVIELSTSAEYSNQQLSSLRPQLEEADELAALLPYATATQAKLIAVLGAGCNGDSLLADALLQLAVRSHTLDVRLACLLAPLDVPPHFLPVLACLALTSHIDFSLRAVACARLIEHKYYSAWPLAKAMLLTGTASDAATPHRFPDWQRTGRYELPKRLLTIMLQQHFATTSGFQLNFEANSPWAVQEQQVATIDEHIKSIAPIRQRHHHLPSWLRLSSSKLKAAPQARQLLDY
ncbi:MAG: hypothetical protein H8E25_14655 [Planctomycetes bacterium]|nr:hypothetical protein [Planctomycetota bacterium]